MAKSRIYLDYNATAPLRPEAAEAVAHALGVTGNASSVHAEGRAVLSGPALARLKNAGLSERFVLELARRGATDELADQAIALRKRGAREDEILRRLARE